MATPLLKPCDILLASTSLSWQKQKVSMSLLLPPAFLLPSLLHFFRDVEHLSGMSHCPLTALAACTPYEGGTSVWKAKEKGKGSLDTNGCTSTDMLASSTSFKTREPSTQVGDALTNGHTVSAHAQWAAVCKAQGRGNDQLSTKLKQSNRT